MANAVIVNVTVVMGPSAVDLRETFQLRDENTLEDTLEILEQFHELSERIRDGQAGIRKG